MKTNQNHRGIFRFTLFGLLGLFALPAVGTAAASEQREAPLPMVEDPDCAQASIDLEIDVLNGKVYLVEGNQSTLVEDEIPVYFGSHLAVRVDLQYTVGEWEVSITPSNGATAVRTTQWGALSYYVRPQSEKYVFSSSAIVGQSTMMAMTPIVPDIIIRSKPTCPPPT